MDAYIEQEFQKLRALEEKSKELQEFRKLVSTSYEKSNKIEISNSSTIHANIVVEYLFRFAIENKNKNDMQIFTGCLDGSFYHKFTQVAKYLLDLGRKITIISMNECDNSDFKKVIEDHKNSKITIVDKKYIKDLQDISHFITVGDKAYRSERNDFLRTAYASFNMEGRGKFLNDIFLDIKNHINQNIAY